jgi:hypothetical protein
MPAGTIANSSYGLGWMPHAALPHRGSFPFDSNNLSTNRAANHLRSSLYLHTVVQVNGSRNSFAGERV